MANLYYSYAKNRQGVLRTVLSSEQSAHLLKQFRSRYAGRLFPSGQDLEGDFATLLVFEGEDHDEYRPGFHLLDESLTRIEEALRQPQK